MPNELDLRQLAFDRAATKPKTGPRRRRLISRYVLPGMVVLGFLGMLGWAARDQYLPARDVTVVPVIVTRAEMQQTGTPLFQAAGWIEPRPTPVDVTALAEGVVQELLVVEGQEVAVDQPVARLIDQDARLELEQAKADFELRTAEVESAQAALHAAELRYQQPVHLQAVLAEAESLLAKTETELARIPFLITAAEARVLFAKQSLDGKEAARAALSERVIQEAQSTYDAAVAELDELKSRQPQLQHEIAALTKRRDALQSQLDLLIDETRAVADAQAQLKAAQARARQAEVAVQSAQLQLDRMIVKSPMAGRVLALVARPGSRVMGFDPLGNTQSSTVVTLYDPQMLQVRADVRLEDVPFIQPGQPALIETASASEPIAGQVLFATSQANVQKNTLEIKVAILAPVPTLRPEMLVTATFLAPEQPGGPSDESQQPERLLVARRLVETVGDGHAVWVADPTGVARRRSIRLGKAGTDELVEVIEGLAPTDRVISTGRDGLSDGDRIRITGEDADIG